MVSKQKQFNPPADGLNGKRHKMYSGPRHTDVGEAMAHNRRVEQAREAEHLRRCFKEEECERILALTVDMDGNPYQTPQFNETDKED